MKNIVKGIIAIVVILIILGINLMNKNVEENGENLLVVGLDDSFPPMGFRDENNEIVGYDIDLAKEVAKELGMEVKFQPISWASKEQELSSGNIDCIWNGFAYNEERAATMTLSDPYIKGENYGIYDSDRRWWKGNTGTASAVFRKWALPGTGGGGRPAGAGYPSTPEDWFVYFGYYDAEAWRNWCNGEDSWVF